MRNVRPDNQSESETETRDHETDDDVLVDLVMIMMMCHMNDWLACLYHWKEMRESGRKRGSTHISRWSGVTTTTTDATSTIEG